MLKLLDHVGRLLLEFIKEFLFYTSSDFHGILLLFADLDGHLSNTFKPVLAGLKSCLHRQKFSKDGIAFFLSLPKN